MVLFLAVRDSYLGLVASAISFYQLVRTAAYAIASALSATVLVLSTPAGHRFPADAG